MLVVDHRAEDTRRLSWPRLKKPCVIFIGTILLILVIGAILYLSGIFGKPESQATTPTPPNPIKPLPPSVSTLHVFNQEAVCADGPPCAEIGKNILKNNGSAVDATIAAMFCMGFVHVKSMGIGGGFLMTIYIKSENRAYTLNAREVAPLASTPNMFGTNQMKPKKGPLAIGVPGKLKGYWAAHKKFGRLPWRDIIQPFIELCEKGYQISRHQARCFKYLTSLNPLYKKWFTGKNGIFKGIGSKVSPKKLCETLKMIATKGGEDFYTGDLAKMILKDLKKAGSIITREDLQKYDVVWSDPITVELKNGDRLYTVPPPGSGILLGYILKILDGYNFTRKNLDGVNNTVLTYHRMAEAFKYAYARRTELGDTNFVNISQLMKDLTDPKYADDTRLQINDMHTFQDPKHYGAVFYNNMSDNGTSHISVLDSNGDAVSVTSTVNIYFGAEVVSQSTGITFNSVMDDFSNPGFKNYFGLPGSPNNAIAPGKRPLSSMSPSIVTDKNGVVKLVIGAAGGTQITTAVAQVIMRVLWFDQNINEAIDALRIHHQVYPMSLLYEFGISKQIIDGLSTYGHNTTSLKSYVVICLLFKKGGKIFVNNPNPK